jgi:hypothetical protein
MLSKGSLSLLLLALSGCTSLPHNRAPVDALHDPQIAAALGALLCRVAPDCAELRLRVRNQPVEQAQMFPDGRLQVNLGLLLATRSEAEIAFVLAHETAHWRLHHRLTRSPAALTQLELLADADAVRALKAAGISADAGLALLQRLLREGQTGVPENPAGDADQVRRRQEGLAQLQARVAALDATGPVPDAPTSAAAVDWPQLLAPYRIRDAGPASQPPQSQPDGP